MEDETKHNIQPLFSFLLAAGGFDPEIHSWIELADMFGIAQHHPDTPEGRVKKGNAALQRWRRFLGTERGLELKKVLVNKKGEISSYQYGRASDPQKAFDPKDVKGAKLLGWTANPNGGMWPRFIVDENEAVGQEQKAEFEKRRADFELSIKAKNIEPKNPKKTGFKNWLILGCVHVPYHNKHLWDGILKYVSNNDIDGVILAGDFLDLHSISMHDKNKVVETNLWDEYMEGYKAIMQLENELPEKSEKIFLYGNHEDRYIRAIQDIEKSRFGKAIISPERALELEERGWKVLNNWKEDYVLLGNNLEVIHGFYTNKTAPKSHLEYSAQTGRSVIFFHTHREGFFSNGAFAAWNCGSLADFDNSAFSYVPRQVRQGWRNGFCLVTIDGQGNHYVTPVRCSEKFFFVNGKKY